MRATELLACLLHHCSRSGISARRPLLLSFLILRSLKLTARSLALNHVCKPPWPPDRELTLAAVPDHLTPSSSVQKNRQDLLFPFPQRIVVDLQCFGRNRVSSPTSSANPTLISRRISSSLMLSFLKAYFRGTCKSPKDGLPSGSPMCRRGDACCYSDNPDGLGLLLMLVQNA
ncbi:hypothetical protein EJB05_15489, partial [Eragrostis curvula]